MNHDTAPSQESEAVGEMKDQLTKLMERTTTQVATLQRKRGHPPILTVEHLGWAIIWCVLQKWVFQRDLWRQISYHTIGCFGRLCISDETVYQRLAKDGIRAMECVAMQVSNALADQIVMPVTCSLANWAPDILALDECVLDPVKRLLIPLRKISVGDASLLAGRLSCLFDVRKQQFRRIDVHNEGEPNCKVQARNMLAGLAKGTLLLFDRGYHAYEWYDDLTRAGLWWITRFSGNTTYNVVHYLIQKDGYQEALVQIGSYRADRAEFLVRMIFLRYKGTWRIYLTNVLDPRRLSGADVIRLYARRWDIELAFKVLKAHLGLNLLWGAKWEVTCVQVWACVILAQVLLVLQGQIALQENVEFYDVSLYALLHALPSCLASGENTLAWVHIHGRRMQIIRPHTRHEPEVPSYECWEVNWPGDEALNAFRRVPRYARKPDGRVKKGKQETPS